MLTGKLKILVNWFLLDYLKSDVNINKLFITKNKIKVVDIFHFFDEGWSIDEFILEIKKLHLDNPRYSNYKNYNDFDNLHNIIKEYPENIRIMVNEYDQIAGYWNCIQLYDKAFQEILDGKLSEIMISTNHASVLISGSYNFYFYSICIKNQYKKSEYIQQLVFSVFKLLELYAENKIYVNSICTIANTDLYRSLCKSIGLELHRDVESGSVYCGSFRELLKNDTFDSFTKLKEFYG